MSSPSSFVYMMCIKLTIKLELEAEMPGPSPACSLGSDREASAEACLYNKSPQWNIPADRTHGYHDNNLGVSYQRLYKYY